MQDGQRNLLEGGAVAENDKIGNTIWNMVKDKLVHF